MPKPTNHLNARPSDAEHKRQQCDGKQRFPTKTAAQAQARTSRTRHSGGDRRLQPYPCRHCRGYHVGSSQAPRQQRRVLDRRHDDDEDLDA